MYEFKKNSVVDEVYEMCMKNIETGVWKAGDKIPSENELSDELKISKVSIRAAMQRLKAMGMVMTYQGKGSFVSRAIDLGNFDKNKPIINLTTKELLDISEFREAIELKTMQLAIERATFEDIDQIEMAFNEMKYSMDDYKRYTRADFRFHMTIYKAAKNDMIYSSVVAIQEVYLRYLEELNKNFGLRDSIGGHETQLNAIKTRNLQMGVEEILSGILANKEKIIKNSKKKE